MEYLTKADVLALHRALVDAAGHRRELRDVGALESAVAQPQMGFGDAELYPTLEAKASALCFSLVGNHPFVDGNKRIGHMAMEAFLILNGRELTASTDDAERTILALAAGKLSREELTEWIAKHLRPTDFV